LWEGASTELNILEVFRSSADGKSLIVQDAGINTSSILTTTGPNTLSPNQMAVGSRISLDKIAVTQQTSGTTAVEANAQCGVITTATLSLLAGASATFTLNNTKIAADSAILVSLGSAIAIKNLSVVGLVTGAGPAAISISNISYAGTTLNGVLTVNFVVF